MAKKQNKPTNHEQLSKLLKKCGFGATESGVLSDSSSRWILLKFQKFEIEFSFEPDGDKLSHVGVYKNTVIKTTKQDLMFKANKKEKKQ